MNGKKVLYIDQYGNEFLASTIKDLRKKVGGGRVVKMYADLCSSKPKHCGYAIGQHRLTVHPLPSSR